MDVIPNAAGFLSENSIPRSAKAGPFAAEPGSLEDLGMKFRALIALMDCETRLLGFLRPTKEKAL